MGCGSSVPVEQEEASERKSVDSVTMGRGSSVSVEKEETAQQKAVDVIVVRVEDGLEQQHMVNDDSAPDNIKACKLWGETLIQDLCDNMAMTGFSSIDNVFVRTSSAISQAIVSVNTVCLLRERIMAVSAGVAGAPMLEVGIVRSSPVVSVVSLGQTKQVLPPASLHHCAQAVANRGAPHVTRRHAALPRALQLRVALDDWERNDVHERVRA